MLLEVLELPNIFKRVHLSVFILAEEGLPFIFVCQLSCTSTSAMDSRWKLLHEIVRAWMFLLSLNECKVLQPCFCFLDYHQVHLCWDCYDPEKNSLLKEIWHNCLPRLAKKKEIIFLVSQSRMRIFCSIPSTNCFCIVLQWSGGSDPGCNTLWHFHLEVMSVLNHAKSCSLESVQARFPVFMILNLTCLLAHNRKVDKKGQ